MQTISVLIDSFDEKNRAQTRQLIELSGFSKPGKYILTNDPKQADIILLCDAEFSDYCKKIRQNKILREYTNKCFILSNGDNPVTLYRGLYTSAEKYGFNFGRIRSCSYTAFFEPYKNQFIANHNSSSLINKKYLFSFIGRNCHKVRSELFQQSFTRKDIIIQDTSQSYNLYVEGLHEISKQQSYYEAILKSKFSLCPRGWGASSFRLFESMKLGVAPVVISDEWILPSGPCWSDFAIIIKEKNLQSLEQIIGVLEDKYIEMGKAAKSAYDMFFAEEIYFDYVINNCFQIKSTQKLPESLFYSLNFFILSIWKVKSGINNFVFRFKADIKILFASALKYVKQSVTHDV